MIDVPHIRNITISGRIGSGQTTLATKLAEKLEWKLLEGGELFRKFHEEKMNDTSELAVGDRPDSFDLEYEESIKKILRESTHNIIQSHLAGFDAQQLPGIFKILVTCEDTQGNDKKEIRIDRLVNRREISIEKAKQEIHDREAANLKKWRNLYAKGDQHWVYWDKKYYDLVINTYNHNAEDTLNIALTALQNKKA